MFTQYNGSKIKEASTLFISTKLADTLQIDNRIKFRLERTPDERQNSKNFIHAIHGLDICANANKLKNEKIIALYKKINEKMNDTEEIQEKRRSGFVTVDKIKKESYLENFADIKKCIDLSKKMITKNRIEVIDDLAQTVENVKTMLGKFENLNIKFDKIYLDDCSNIVFELNNKVERIDLTDMTYVDFSKIPLYMRNCRHTVDIECEILISTETEHTDGSTIKTVNIYALYKDMKNES